MSTISFFSSIDALTTQPYSVDLYLSHIQDGLWREMLEPIRQGVSEADSCNSLPIVAISGLFSIHTNGLSLIQHSGFIAMDVEGFRDLQRGKQILSLDKYTYAVFENYSGKALTVVVRIPASDHMQAYQALSEYYEGVYGLITDPSDQFVTRFRYVTYDPDLRGNPKAEVFCV
ncbi:BT4734/BF3469 family protein [Xanthocytophaga flava]|uniref:BT4734/BF3469 family protein n=1 Tax=Xanthocytophaga flava TaxID=3048013 RepID=UPI0028D8FF12|nr:BT4734/BF3469 family protein [Xanthocytophaga flavus]MDJ1473769.1 BT4734/BF3469 family protein [Xanthocytophaga flavus]